MPNITPFLWFDDNAEEAVNFYVSTFKNAKIDSINRFGEETPGPKGRVMTIAFSLDGTDFVAFNGGHTNPDGEDMGSMFSLSTSRAISFVVTAKTQAELDDLWEKLVEGGAALQCGWLTDKFGVTWQVVPEGLSDLLAGEDADGSARAMQAMLAMVKLDIGVLRRAYEHA
jgi:predicted 3-demethylubiquinone-9 3-methyltransferase (glyoxalase superfamily)